MDRLKDIYFDIKSAGSFSGADTLYKEARKRNIKITKDSVKKWLYDKLPYTLHKPVKRKFKRNKTIAFYIDQHWQLDLCDVRALKSYNDNHTYILTVIDIFSRFAFCRALQNKSAPTVLKAFEDILSTSNRSPENICSDAGGEFLNNTFKRAMNKKNITFFVTTSELKASVIERFNRTLKQKLYRYYTHANTFRYIDILQKLIESYNKTPHRSLGYIAPADVTKENQLDIWERYHAVKKPKFPKFKFDVGDYVRISRHKNIFEKGYINNWSEEYFIVYERLPRVPPVYRIKDLNDENIDGIFYEQQLQKIIPPENHIIEKILHQRGNKVLVRWRGFPNTFDSYIKVRDLIKL